MKVKGGNENREVKREKVEGKGQKKEGKET